MAGVGRWRRVAGRRGAEESKRGGEVPSVRVTVEQPQRESLLEAFDPPIAFLQKPFSTTELLRALPVAGTATS